MLSNNWQKFSYIPQGKSTQRFQCFLQQKKEENELKLSTANTKGETIFEIVTFTLFNDVTRDSIANNFVIEVHCRCLKVFYQIAMNCKI